MDELLNTGFFVFHGAWIVFNCTGWIWRRTRRWHLATTLLTLLSWFGLGIRYGWGYCPCTDWHWAVRERLGSDVPPSYVQLLVRQFTGIDLALDVANALAVVVLGAAIVLSVFVNLRDYRASRTLTVR
jgi:hypothetical protein